MPHVCVIEALGTNFNEQNIKIFIQENASFCPGGGELKVHEEMSVGI